MVNKSDGGDAANTEGGTKTATLDNIDSGDCHLHLQGSCLTVEFMPVL